VIQPNRRRITVLWIVATLVLFIVGLGGLFVGLGSPPGDKTIGYAVAGGAVVVWVVLTVAFSLHNIGQRQVGIVYNFSGTITGRKDPGTVMTAPWQHIKTENVGIQKEVFDFSGNNAAVSKDQQPIDAELVVNYQVEPAHVVDLYKTVGAAWKNVLLDGRVPQDFKETTAQFSSPDITLKRPELRRITLSRLRAELGQYDIRVVDVFVNNVAYSDAYTRAIEEKQVQVQAALRAEAKVAQATAEANQRIATARGEAASISLEGKALRNNPEVLKLKAINALNPHAQIIFCANAACPSFIPQALAGG
jgi:regulator of protease activity HflC (stomatin/prohibitin superfamily)